MDHRLISFNLSAPSNYKIYNGWTKYYTRIAFVKKLPEYIKDKIGWSSPEKTWLFNKNIS
tara:strand:+ start:268 stop:447 length:180 start_codon:yes stop_codon:yes gene_type:complete